MSYTEDLVGVLEVIAGARTAAQLRGVALLAAELEPGERDLARWAYAYALAELRETV